MKYLKLKFLLMFFALAMAIPPAWAGTVYQLLTDASQLEAGKTLIIASVKSDNQVRAMYQQTSNNFSSTIVNVTANNTITAPGNAHILTLEGTTNKWNFKTMDNKYLYAASSSNNYLRSKDNIDESGNSNATIVTYDNGISEITFQGNYTHKYLKYNSGSQIFSCYSGGQQDVYIYIETEVSDTYPSIRVNPLTLDINQNGGVFTVSAANMPDGGLGALIDSSSPSNAFSFSKTSDNTFNDVDNYFPLTGNSNQLYDLESGTVQVNYTGHALSAAGVIAFESGSERATANVNYLYDGDIYIVGDVEGSGWSTEGGVVHGVRLVKNADGTYSATVTATAGGEGFSWLYFTKSLNASNYDDLGYNRFGPAGDYGSWSYNSGLNGVYCDLDTEGNLHTIKMSPGNYIFTIDPANNKFKIEEVAAPKIYNKVTHESQLIAGKKYILVYEKTPAFMGAISETSTPYGLSITGPTLDGSSVNIGQYGNIRELTLSGDASGWNFHNGEGYLTCTSTKSLNVATEISDNAKWTVSKNDDGFVLTNKAAPSRILQYNASSPRFACYEGTQPSAVLYVEDGVEPSVLPTVATPTFSPDGGSYKTPQSVTINCATEGAEIRYTTDGTDPTANSTLYDGPITVNTPNATTTIKAIGVKTDMNNSGIATAEYTLPQSVNTLAAANALAPETGNSGVDFFFTGDVVVTYAGGDYIWLRDVGANTGGGLFYRTGTEVTTPGAVLSQNWGATAKQYRGLIEFTDAEGVETSGNTAAYAPFKRTGVELTDAHMNEYIVFNNVRIDSKDPEDQNGKTYHATYVGENREDITYQLYDQFGKSPEVGKTYNITGLVTKYNDIQVYPTELVEVIQQVAKPTFNPGTGEYTTIQNVEISCATQGATISYKIGENGEWKTYTEPIEVAESCTITAKATKTGMDDSDEASATYTINLPTLEAPTFEPEAGTYDVAQNVAISAAEGAAISYKIGDAEAWTTYSKPITVNESCIITAKATKKGFIDSPEASAEYKFRQKATLSFGETTAFTVYPNDTKFTAPTLTTNPEGLTPIKYTSSDEDVAAFVEGELIIGSKLATTTITAAFEGNDDYKPASATYTITVEPRPCLVADETVDMGTEKTKEFDVVGENLKGVVTLTCNNENFVVTPTEITPTEGAVEQTVTVTYNGSSYTDETATITVASQDAESVIVTVKAHIAKPALVAVEDELEFEALVGKTDSKTFIVTGENLKGDVTLTLDDVNGVYSIEPTTITKADAEADGGKKVTVTYTPKAKSIDEATITITTDGLAEPVTVTLTGKATLPDPVLKVSTDALEMGTNPTGTFTVTGQNLTEDVTVTVNEEAAGKFTVNPATITMAEAMTENGKTVTVTYTGNSTTDEYATITVKSGTEKKEVIVTARVLPTPVIEIDEGTLDLGTTGEGSFYLMATDLRGNITLSCENENFTVSPTTITPEEAEEGVTITVTYTGNNTVGETAYITIKTEGGEDVVITVTAKAETYVNIAAPTFAPAAGTYTEAKEVAIACATPGVTIEYKIGDGNWTLYEKPFEVKNSCTVYAKASKGDKVVYNDSEVAEAKYTINTLPAAQIDNKYYYLVNNALPEMYANVAGRRTLNFVADPADKAGTVFRIATDGNGKVLTLRSQACDIQDYAKRAMNYVPVIVQTVINKLNNTTDVDSISGAGNLLGENGFEAIMKAFNDCFDYNLYVEGSKDNYRIYARTPSMQNVVDFYAEHKDQVDEKLPMLEDYINQVLAKIRSKVQAANLNPQVFEDFSLLTLWEEMGKKLIKPDSEENVKRFYEQVLTNKEYVWDFAYYTAKHYLDNIKGTTTYQNLINLHPEIESVYLDKLEEIRPETKFFIIQNGNEPDYVSETHTYIVNDYAQTYWTLAERTGYDVAFPAENVYNGQLVTTLYTDFAYDVPDGVTAYKVTGVKTVNEQAIAEIEALNGTVPAQTPVLLMTPAAKANVTKTVTLNTNDGTRPNGNLLEGPDYLINKYKITSPTVEALFAIAAGIVGGEESDAYQTYVKPYEYLKLRTSGTVNNRYFWGLSADDLKKCTEENSNGKLDCVVRALGVDEEGQNIGFYRNREAMAANQAFIPNIEFNPILLEVVATPTFAPEAGTYNEAQNVTIACETEGATIYYKTGDAEDWTEYDPEQPIRVEATTTIQAYAAKDGLGDSEIAEATYTIELPAEAPTFDPVPGSYTEAQQVTIIAPEGATVTYRIDGGEWQTYTEGEKIQVEATQTIEAKVEMEGMSESAVATGYYVIDIPEALPTDMPTFDGYYSVLNSGKYANIQGRKTLTFTDAPDAQAGTVIRLKSDNTGKVEVLRSQAADLQRYAYRAMDYVPDIVQIVVDKLGAEGEGHILGKDGLDAIMTKFDESFKPDLYIEKAGDNGYRIYGRTPSMQPVVDFYRENKDKVEAKLPDLVAFINSALAKLRNKANQAGMDGDNVFVDFDLKTIWTRMGGNLTDPEVDEMGFYRDVLNYKDNVWNFAYQTATFYLEKIKNTGTYTSLSEQLGEFAQYLDKIDQIHPDFKYYIVANEGVTKPDFISEGNTDIANDAARTIWTIEPRENFTVNFPEENKLGDEYVTTLYTDFAYTLPEGVTAWAVENVNEQGIAKLAKVDDTTIAAQTPVLLKSTTAGDVATFGITTAEGTVPATNELVGPDYLIETYQIKTPEVVKMFEAIKTVLGENIYNDLVDKYGHLQFRTSGTVNNKYFWGLNEEEVKSCAEENPETGKKVKVVRSLGIKDDILGFNDNEHVYTNKALLVSTEHSAITFTLRGDINRDGQITIADVPALIDILLELPAEPYHEPSELYPNYPKGLDYEAADFNENGDITIHDVSALIDYLLGV